MFVCVFYIDVCVCILSILYRFVCVYFIWMFLYFRRREDLQVCCASRYWMNSVGGRSEVVGVSLRIFLGIGAGCCSIYYLLVFGGRC